jgi:cholesterol transport system auxiliary component
VTVSCEVPRPILPLLLLAPLLAGLAGCSTLLRSDQAAVQLYTLRAPPVAAVAAVAAGPAGGRPDPRATLRVASPTAGPGLDSAKIVLVRPDHRMDFYASSEWSAAAPSLVGALAIETLRASGAWRAVQGPGSAFPADDLLEISIRRFEADYPRGAAAPSVRVLLECTLGREDSRQVIASFVARGEAVASANRMSDVVGAFQQATDAALASMTRQAAAAQVRSR